MILREPFLISARLLPSIKFGAGWISWDGANFIIDLDGKEFIVDTYSPGAFHTTQSCFGDILSFLSQAGEEVAWGRRTGENPYASQDGCANIFPREVSEWAADHYDDMSCVASDCDSDEEFISE